MYGSYQPLLNDLQNLIEEESSKEGEFCTVDEQRRKDLLGHELPVTKRPVPKAEKIFDFQFREDGARSPLESSLCKCGYAHFLNGKEYDIVFSIVEDAYVGLNMGDYPEDIVRKALEDREISATSYIPELAKSIRKSFGNHFFANEPPKIKETEKKKTIQPVILPKISTKAKNKTKSESLRDSLKELKNEEVIKPNETKLENVLDDDDDNEVTSKPKKHEKPATQMRTNPTSSSASAKGMDDYLRRSQMKHELHKQKLQAKEEEKRKHDLIIQKTKAMIKTFDEVEIPEHELQIYGVSPIPSGARRISFTIKTMDYGDLKLSLTPQHHISDVKLILDKLIRTNEAYSLITMIPGKATLPTLVLDHNTLEQDGIDNGTFLLQIPGRPTKFP